MIRDRLFCQTNRSFDFGKNLIYQYTTSSTHSSTPHLRMGTT